VNGRQPLFTIDTSLSFRTIFIRVDRKYDGRNVKVAKDGIDDAYLFRFRPYDVFTTKKVSKVTLLGGALADLVDTPVQD
jgi:hypothetical protein